MKMRRITLSLLSLLFLAGSAKSDEFTYKGLYAGQVNVMGTFMELPDFTKWHYFAFDEANGVVLKGTSEFELENLTPARTGAEVINAEWQARTDWDVAFHAFDIRTNSGIAGNGRAGAAFIADAASPGGTPDQVYAGLKEAPDVSYPADAVVNGSFYLSFSGMPPVRATSLSVSAATRKAGEGGASADFSTLAMAGGPTVNPMVVVFKTTAGKYVKVYLKQFIEDGKPGFLKFDYEFIPLQNGTGISRVKTEPVAVYPNPVTDVLNINLSGKADIAIYTLHGSMVKQLKAQTGKVSIPVSDLAKGIYLVKTSSGSASSTQKILVK
ncbi:hypothetical protein AGMMS49574_17950 [Bacteroidia bacterium]|nr:hypothetical protein AGMMS49574_17950 [Bacteroidia bacterium]